MAKYPPLWNQAISYPAQLDRSLLGALWPAGGVLGGVASAVANTLQVSIAPGSVAVPLQAGQGTALCHWDAAELVTLDPGPGAGTTRVDLIVAQVRDNAIDGGPNNDWLFTVVKGTPATMLAETREEEGDEAEAEQQAVAPAVPANSLAVAQVTVPATAVNLNGVPVVDLRPGPLAVGGVIARVTLGPAAQAQITVGGSWADWSSGLFTLPFVAPASGAVMLDAEYGLVVSAGGTVQAGWQGGGIGNGSGPGLCSSEYVAQATASQFGLTRVHTSHLITGLTPGQRYTPAYWLAALAQTGIIYYGGNGVGGNFTNNAGPVLLTARAA